MEGEEIAGTAGTTMTGTVIVTEGKDVARTVDVSTTVLEGVQIRGGPELWQMRRLSKFSNFHYDRLPCSETQPRVEADHLVSTPNDESTTSA